MARKAIHFNVMWDPVKAVFRALVKSLNICNEKQESWKMS